jgi:hypothetical protein
MTAAREEKHRGWPGDSQPPASALLLLNEITGAAFRSSGGGAIGWAKAAMAMKFGTVSVPPLPTLFHVAAGPRR